MSDNLLLINCPICDSENHQSFSTGGSPIIACWQCGAPICDSNRPVISMSSYQDQLKQWGRKFRESNATKIETHIKGNAENRQQQIENTELRQKVIDVQAEVEDRNQKIQIFQREFESQLSQQRSSFQADIKEWEKKYQLLKAQYESELKKHAVLQTDIENWKSNYRVLQDKHATSQSGLTSLLKIVQESNQGRDRYIETMLNGFETKWKKFKATESKVDKSILAKISGLITNDISQYGSTETFPDIWEKDYIEGLDNSLVDVSAQGENTASESSIKNETTPNDGASNIPVEQSSKIAAFGNDLSTIGEIDIESIFQPPLWIAQYNHLLPSDARHFKETHNAKRFTVPQDSLENQRVTLDAPIFIEGAGSYWCIYDTDQNAYFLVLDRERFRFNDSNYESITVCYNFNRLNQSDFKYFEASDYELNVYQINQPAQVVPIEDTGRWQLFTRGWLEFREKTKE
jgi:hypothetical protein